MAKGFRLFATLLTCLLTLAVTTVPATALPIGWTTWTSGTTSPTAGSAGGTITLDGNVISVTYAGEMRFFDDQLAWLPESSFEGGRVDNAPPSAGDVLHPGIALFGGTAVVNTVTFSEPVMDPVLAIWSLGNPGSAASFNFTLPVTIEAGGPNSEFGGSSIVFCNGDMTAVCGLEGNGVVGFAGTFTQLSWTNPIVEGYYAFTVGAPFIEDGPPPDGVIPEPATLLLLGGGLIGRGLVRRGRARR